VVPAPTGPIEASEARAEDLRTKVISYSGPKSAQKLANDPIPPQVPRLLLVRAPALASLCLDMGPAVACCDSLACTRTRTHHGQSHAAVVYFS
jgi:hypothetical protein